VHILINTDKLTSRFVADLSEKQITANEFFNTGLLDALRQDFSLDKAMIFIYDTDGKFLSWIAPDGIKAADSKHPYCSVMSHDKMRDAIYREAVRDELTYYNHTPRVYRNTDFYEKAQYDKSRFVNFLENKFGAHYMLSLAFGLNAYIQISFFKSREEGDYSDKEIELFKELYRYIAMAYSGFKRHEQAKIISKIQNEIISAGERAYLITDDFTHVMGYNEEALKLLTSICGTAIAAQIENEEPCLWVPFLVCSEDENAAENEPAVRKIKNLIFKIHTYDQSYSHGIVDRYHWIGISQQDAAKHKTSEEISLTASEKKVAALLYEGLTYQKIADELCISYHTVKNHVQNIFSKCDVSSRYELFKVLDGKLYDEE
jgi:DNA-binding CsgD family transcriptional regulator